MAANAVDDRHARSHITPRSYIEKNLAIVERFLKAYVEAARLIKKDSALVEQVIKKYHRETDAAFIKKTAEVYARIFKPIPYVSSRIGDRRSRIPDSTLYS